MPQEYTLQQALKEAIMAKKELRDFYREAAETTDSDAGKQVLKRLSDEVEANIGKFFKYYRGEEFGDLGEFLTSPPLPQSVMLIELRKAIDKNVHAKKARELAMREEKAMEESFRLAAMRVVDPLVREVFLEVAEDAAKHYALIESEYDFQTTRIHDTDVNTYVRE